jgi:hypothetical protein
MGTTAISGRPKTLGNTSQALVPCDQHDHNTHYYVYVWHVCKSYLTLGTSTILGMSYLPCLLTQSCELLGGVLALIVAILIGTKMQLTRPGMCHRTTQRRTHS